MKNTLVVVADLGCLKAYRLDTTPVQHTPRLELLEEFSSNGGTPKPSEVNTDSSGRFPRGGAHPAGGMSDGERHNLALEQRRRLVRKLAGRLSQLLHETGAEDCYLAASREIHNHLIEELEPALRARIVRSVHADLTRVDKAELLAHF
ncbi:MAG: host attachment protein [Verrucomicrobia bacterium]|jgi:hypothetical protein|nr:host attachment protein [Verrucomicrobiota bacterium]